LVELFGEALERLVSNGPIVHLLPLQALYRAFCLIKPYAMVTPSTSKLLPISIILPTRNSMERLPSHLSHHAAVFGRCQEIIHCDSHSTDGTPEFVRRSLIHAGLRQIDHPPGLYQSWNRAILHCTQPFIYISTIGDELAPDGLEKLLAVAEQEDADIVISPPRFVTENGERAPDREWPIHRLISRYRITEPVGVPGHVLFANAIVHLPHGITGSAASCLFRTAFLQQRLFPLGFHGACDTAGGSDTF
jgi:hypothetical protein